MSSDLESTTATQMEAMETSRDAFLGGLVHVHQPKKGRHRAGTDAVFLAAALPDSTKGHVVDLGAGVGTAGFCAAARLSDITVTLVEIDQPVIGLAQTALKDPANSSFANRISVLPADVTAKGSQRHETGLKPGFADHVIMNPPYYPSGTFRASPASARASAHMLDDRGLDPWVRTAADILRDGGSLTLIFRADGLKDLLDALSRRFGAIDIIPLRPRFELAATRVVIRAVRASKAPLQLLPGFVLHEANGSDFTDLASSVMRDGKGLGITARK